MPANMDILNPCLGASMTIVIHMQLKIPEKKERKSRSALTGLRVFRNGFSTC